MPMTVPFSGGCACGHIRYLCHAEPVAMINCHCEDCQRSSGAPYASGFIVPVSAMDTAGVASSFSVRTGSGSTATRSFCPKCGSPLFATSDTAQGFMSVRFSTLDDTTEFQPQYDVWTSSAQPWTCMNSSLPHFARDPA